MECFTGKSSALSVIADWLEYFICYCQLCVFRVILFLRDFWKKSAAASTHRSALLGPVLVCLPEGLLCSRDIGWVKEKYVWIVSVSVCLCLLLHFGKKRWFSDFWCAYIRCKFQETGSSWLKFKNPNCAQFGFLKFGTIQVFKFQTIHRIIETQ